MNQNENLIFSKINDKLKFCNSKNKITYLDFFTEPEIFKIEKYLKQLKVENFLFFGGKENTERKMLFFYPEKINYELALKTANEVLQIIRIILPNNLKNTFEHRDYLSAIMKLGIVRQKFGDIIVYEEGADIIVQKENAIYFKQNLEQFVRFRKSNIDILNIFEIHEIKNNLEEISIVVNSMRIDNFVSEITHTSRNKTEEILRSRKSNFKL